MDDIDLPDETDQHGIDAEFDEWPDDPRVVLGIRVWSDDVQSD